MFNVNINDIVFEIISNNVSLNPKMFLFSKLSQITDIITHIVANINNNL